jgi:excisionase family DNA binding protein
VKGPGADGDRAEASASRLWEFLMQGHGSPSRPDPASPPRASQSKQRVTWTVHETAERLGLTLSTVYAYIESGELPAVRLGRRLLVPREAVERLVENAMGRWDGSDAG